MGIFGRGVSSMVLKDNLGLDQFSSHVFVRCKKDIKGCLPADDTSIAGAVNNRGTDDLLLCLHHLRK